MEHGLTSLVAVSDPLNAFAMHASAVENPRKIPPVESLTAQALPTWHELLAAFCGHIGDDPGDHPVTRWARMLAELHSQRDDTTGCIAEIDSRRAELAAAIDRWAADHARAPACALDAGLGAAVDRMAAAQVRANQLLRTAAEPTEVRVRSAWFHLATLADEWTDLAATVTAGQPYHPSEAETE